MKEMNIKKFNPFYKMRAFFLLLFVFFSFSLASAAISDFNVSPEVMYGEILRVDGTLSPIDAEFCSFRLYDSNGTFIYRLTDEKVSEAGAFSSSYFKVDEPLVFRGEDYNLTVNCAGSTATKAFSVQNRRPFSFFLQQEFLFLTDRNNLESFAFFGALIAVFVLIVLIGAYWFFGMRRVFGSG